MIFWGGFLARWAATQAGLQNLKPLYSNGAPWIKTPHWNFILILQTIDLCKCKVPACTAAHPHRLIQSKKVRPSVFRPPKIYWSKIASHLLKNEPSGSAKKCDTYKEINKISQTLHRIRLEVPSHKTASPILKNKRRKISFFSLKKSTSSPHAKYLSIAFQPFLTI